MKNHKINIVNKVLNGTAPLLLSKISKKLRMKKTVNIMPGNKIEVRKAFLFQLTIPKILHIFPAHKPAKNPIKTKTIKVVVSSPPL